MRSSTYAVCKGTSMTTYDVVIIGAGAAGMMCAIEAGKRGQKVLLVDHAKNPGEKIRISGGGRCNFTNLHIKPERFLSQNRHFCKSALKRYTQHDFVDLVTRHGIPYHEKDNNGRNLGQLFCDGSAKEIIQMLRDEMDSSGVELRLSTDIKYVEKQDHGEFWIVFNEGEAICKSLVVACGGKSIPKMGATSLGYAIAEQFDLQIVETRPALVPLTFTDDTLAAIKPLSGVSVQSSVRHKKTEFDEGLLFTHRGLSGPSILQISSYWREGDEIIIDLMRGENIAEQLKSMRGEHGKQSLQNVLARLVPSKLAAMVVGQSGLDGNLADQSNSKLDQIGNLINAWRVKPAGSEGYRTAEVTLGGVDTDALNSKTMEVKEVPGLYFIGEVVDVTGWLGGYNFQWAWSSGWVCGQVC